MYTKHVSSMVVKAQNQFDNWGAWDESDGLNPRFHGRKWSSARTSLCILSQNALIIQVPCTMKALKISSNTWSWKANKVKTNKQPLLQNWLHWKQHMKMLHQAMNKQQDMSKLGNIELMCWNQIPSWKKPFLENANAGTLALTMKK